MQQAYCQPNRCTSVDSHLQLSPPTHFPSHCLVSTGEPNRLTRLGKDFSCRTDLVCPANQVFAATTKHISLPTGLAGQMIQAVP
uniref:Uncharacterized protein n=1 Tax=Arundo donax TaxID=35708 RepID=A0A0A8Z8M4_ARUDO